MSFNRINTYQWFKANTYYLDENHNPYDQVEAFRKATEMGKLALGVFYLNPNKPTFEENVRIYEKDPTPLFQREVDKNELENYKATSSEVVFLDPVYLGFDLAIGETISDHVFDDIDNSRIYVIRDDPSKDKGYIKDKFINVFNDVPSLHE